MNLLHSTGTIFHVNKFGQTIWLDVWVCKGKMQKLSDRCRCGAREFETGLHKLGVMTPTCLH